MKYPVYAKFLRYLKPYIFLEITLLLLLLFTSAASLASPYFLKVIIDEVFPSRDYTFLIRVIVVLTLIYILRILASVASDIIYTKLSSKVVADIRQELFAHLLSLPLSFFGKHPVGDIVHRINNEVDNIQDVLTNSIIRFINTIFSIVGLIVALALLNFKLLLISCMVLPVIFTSVAYFTPRVRKLYQRINGKEGALQAYFQERFSSVLLIKVMNAFTYEYKRLKKDLSALIHDRVNATRLSSVNRNITTFLIAIGPLIVFLWGGKDVLSGVMTLGALVAFIQYQNRLYSPFMDLMYLYNDIVRTTVSMDRIFELFDYGTGTVTAKGLAVPRPLRDIRFKDVSFRYHEDDKEVFKSLNLVLEAGKIYGLKGPSGSGKSTLIKLLCQYYEPTSGLILINGTNLRDLDSSQWISGIHLASQETFLFNESLRYNINYARDEKNDGELLHACGQSGLKTFIEGLPDGLDTALGERGNLLSGGQRQRVALARLFLNYNYDIIILDEVTSGLDFETEKLIMQNLIDAKPADSLLIIISHRPQAFEIADEIIMLN